MRMADFSDDASSVGTARALSQTLMRHKVTSQLRAIDRAFPPNVVTDVEALPQLQPAVAQPEPLDLVYGAGLITVDLRYTSRGQRTSPVMLCDPRIYGSPVELGSLEPLRSSASSG